MQGAIPTRYGRVSSIAPLETSVLAAERVQEASEIWQRLELAHGGGGLTSGWTWTSAWLRHYGDIVAHRFVVAECEGEPVGIALLTRGTAFKRGPITVRSIHIGTAGEPNDSTVRVEYNRLLVDPRHRVDFAALLLRSAGRVGFACDELWLDGFAPDELSAFVVAEPALELDRAVCHVADLRPVAASNSHILDHLRRHTASKIRRSMRRIEESLGPISVEWATSMDQAREMFAELCALHQERWQRDGQPGVFHSERFTGFHRDLIDELFGQGRIVLARVHAGSETLGCDYGFIEHGRVLSYQWGIRQFEDSRLSPGLVVGASIMQEAAMRGLVEYDWLAGDVLYKKELSTTTRELVWAHHSRGSRMRALDAAVRIRQFARTYGRQSATGVAAASSAWGV